MSDELLPEPDLEGAPPSQDVPAAPAGSPESEQTTLPSAESGARRSPAALRWGVALVLLGLALLVNQFAPGVRLWQYWPLIVVAVGVRGVFGPKGGPWTIRHPAEGLVTVAFGLVLLGQMTGYLGWNVWLSILQLWPLLLVSVGLEIMGKGLHSEWIRALGSVVVIGGLAYGSLVMTATGGWPPSILPVGESEPFEYSAAHESGVEEGKAEIRGGVGALSVKAGRNLVTAEGRSPFEPDFKAEIRGRRADVSASLGSDTWGPVGIDARLDVSLDRQVRWDVDVDAGVTQYEIDLSELEIGALDLDAGVSDGVLVLGPSSRAGGEDPVVAIIDAGVSSLRIRVPEGDDVRLVIGQGLTSVDTKGDWTSSRDGDARVYESDGFRGDGAYWDIRIEAGIGGVTVEYY
ncbi:MAG: hypothetical protein JXA36_04275 [Coriobacteriia bacterium]|nr:hypothetical protein [Coriobacteriia bacterium]